MQKQEQTTPWLTHILASTSDLPLPEKYFETKFGEPTGLEEIVGTVPEDLRPLLIASRKLSMRSLKAAGDEIIACIKNTIQGGGEAKHSHDEAENKLTWLETEFTTLDSLFITSLRFALAQPIATLALRNNFTIVKVPEKKPDMKQEGFGSGVLGIILGSL